MCALARFLWFEYDFFAECQGVFAAAACWRASSIERRVDRAWQHVLASCLHLLYLARRPDGRLVDM